VRGSCRPDAEAEADLADRLCDAIKELTAERASRFYATQFVMLHSVTRHLGISDEGAQEAVALGLKRHRIQIDGSGPPHSVSPIWPGAKPDRAGNRL
jgi:hypothetical protein